MAVCVKTGRQLAVLLDELVTMTSPDSDSGPPGHKEKEDSAIKVFRSLQAFQTAKSQLRTVCSNDGMEAALLDKADRLATQATDLVKNVGSSIRSIHG